MPMNNFSVGRDIILAITTATGTLSTHNVTKFSSKPEYKKSKVNPLDGRIIHQRFPDGWTGTLEIERADSSIDDYFAADEAGYYAGNNSSPCSITEIIQEPDGSVSEYQYTGVVLSLTNAGDWSSDTTVKQTLSFDAARRIKR